MAHLRSSVAEMTTLKRTAKSAGENTLSGVHMAMKYSCAPAVSGWKTSNTTIKSTKVRMEIFTFVFFNVN